MARAGIPPSRARRALDLAVALTALPLLSPLLLAVGIAVRLSSPGPVIYRQTRVGQGRVPFDIYKFRSMRDDEPGPELTGPADSRVTRLGQFLRRTSLDELPQLINVLRGEMTLVGPRPESLALAARYPAEYQFVFQHRPGLTGPVQVRLRDQDILPADVEDLQDYYLRRLLPARIALDRGYLANPTLARTIGLLTDTAAYLIRRPKTRLPAQPVEVAP
jgi:lipopolysaccharide/colanic/teichoic acid biosynthesis glycosyltransferase